MEFHLKNGKIIFETFFSPSFDVLHSSPIVYMDHTERIFQDLLLYCTKKVAENHNQFFHFCHGVKHTPGACSDLDIGHIKHYDP